MTALDEARDQARYYDSLNAAERLERGELVLAEVQAHALISIAESLSIVAVNLGMLNDPEFRQRVADAVEGLEIQGRTQHR